MRKILKIDIKNNIVINSIMYEGVSKIGNPIDVASKSINTFIDELFLSNLTGTLYGFDNFKDTLSKICNKLFIPITVGGGITTLKECEEMFYLGADKISLNSSLFKSLELLKSAVKNFGSQSISVLIQAKKLNGKWYAFKDMARENTNYLVKDWINICEKEGAGEIIIVSVDDDGLNKGLNFDLYDTFSHSDVPIILGGGFSGDDDLRNLTQYEKIDGITTSSYFYKKFI